MALIYLSLAWLAGICLGSSAAVPSYSLAVGLLPLSLLPLAGRHRHKLLLSSLCLLLLTGGALRFQASAYGGELDRFQGETVEIEGNITSDPENRGQYRLFDLEVERLMAAGAVSQVSGKVLVRTGDYVDYRYGDHLQVSGLLEKSASPVRFSMDYPRVRVLSRPEGAGPFRFIYSLRQRLAESLSRMLPEPQNSFAQGILLGIRSGIPVELREALARTGTAHLLAISGFNLTILLGMVLSLNVWAFGRQRSAYFWLTLAAMWFYTTLTGLQPPVVRAAIMGSLFLLAEYLGRQKAAAVALVFSAAVMTAVTPDALFGLSFQLSFLAMSGLIFLAGPWQTWLRQRISSMKRAGWLAHLADSLSVTLGATLATLPLTTHSFGIVSVVGLPATFFAILPLPGIILVSAAAAALGLFLYPPAQVFAWIDWLFLSYFIQVVRAFDALPFSSQKVAISAWQVWGYYALLTAGLAAYSYKQLSSRLLSSIASSCRKATATIGGLILARPQLWCLGFLLAASLVWTAALTQPDDRLHVSFLDVGQGDAVLISRGAQQVLIDGGPNAGRIALELGDQMPFHDREIELVVSTQPQADHLVGLVEVARRYQVRQVAESGLTSRSATYRRWQSVLAETHIPGHPLRAGDQLDLGRGVKIEVLNPPEQFHTGTSDDPDNNGLVLRLVYGEVSFLFTADVRQDVERELVAELARLRSTVLKVSHHGSRSSTGEEFLAAVSPQAAVICSGKDNPFGHPHREVMERLTARLGNQVYLTAAQGTVEFLTDGKRLWVNTAK